ncbi:MAG: NifU family protein [Actinomycetota bacterium]
MRDPIVTVTDRARNRALAVRDEEPDGKKLVLFLEITEPDGLQYGYDLFFDDETAIKDGDIVQDEGALRIVISADSADKLRGATLDLSNNLLSPGWVVENPNSPSPAVGAGIKPGDFTGTIEERVSQVLEQVVNPAIAMHGGHADLVAVSDDTVYVQLSGGCQGCGLASVTLTQGIEVSVREAIPEIARVVDTTDHAAGSNPYYQPAKK